MVSTLSPSGPVTTTSMVARNPVVQSGGGGKPGGLGWSGVSEPQTVMKIAGSKSFFSVAVVPVPRSYETGWPTMEDSMSAGIGHVAPALCGNGHHDHAYAGGVASICCA